MTDPTFEQKVTAWIAGQGQKQEERSSVWKWIVSAIVGVLALGAIAWLYFKLWRQSKELAQLRHDRDVAAEKVVRAEVESKIVDNLEAYRVARADAFTAHHQVETLKNAIDRVEVEHKQVREAVDALQNWDDVDRYLGKPPGDGPGSAQAPP